MHKLPTGKGIRRADIFAGIGGILIIWRAEPVFGLEYGTIVIDIAGIDNMFDGTRHRGGDSVG